MIISDSRFFHAHALWRSRQAEVMAGNKVEYGRAEMKATVALGVREASGLAPLGDGSFFVVDDEQGIYRCMPGGNAKQLDAGRGLVDLEGIAITPDGKHACVLSEHDGSVWRFGVDDGNLRDGELLGTLTQMSKTRNRGWEGIAFAGAGTFGDQGVLVAVHQVKPRRIGLFNAETMQQHALLRMPKDARQAIGELNDIAVDADGRILLLSGKSGRIAEMRLEGEALSLMRVYRIQTSKNDVPEGISIDAGGRVWVCTDGKGMLRQYELQP